MFSYAVVKEITPGMESHYWTSDFHSCPLWSSFCFISRNESERRRGLEDGKAGKSTRCSCRGPEFGSHPPMLGASHSSMILVPGTLTPFLLLWTPAHVLSHMGLFSSLLLIHKVWGWFSFCEFRRFVLKWRDAVLECVYFAVFLQFSVFLCAGWIPETLEEWKLLLYLLQNRSTRPTPQEPLNGSLTDGPAPINVGNVALLLAKALGPDQAWSLLQECGLALELSAKFTRTCDILRIAERRQR